MERVIILLVFIFSVVFGAKKCVEDKTVAKQDINEKRIDSLQKVVDSLSLEAFIQKTNVDRYEIALGILKERDSIAANKFETILYTEIE